jgi:hypothetical protein
MLETRDLLESLLSWENSIKEEQGRVVISDED